MKLKKKHFKKLKEIAVAVNQIVPGTGIRLDKLIAEIESVQRVRKEYFANPITGQIIEVGSMSKEEEHKAAAEFFNERNLSTKPDPCA